MNKPRTFVRPLAAAEPEALDAGRASAAGFAVRRPPLRLARAARVTPADNGGIVGWARAGHGIPGCAGGR